ncbi:MAG TPA: transposase, partial [Rickettsia endosymbiont of Diachasma alloeum]|nr:transposase [Rickettsia endosymbiont of Diachasma alloeum]
HFWGRGYFSTTSGHITDEVINEYINNIQKLINQLLFLTLDWNKL